MARSPDARAVRARELYGQGLKLIEIANTLDVSEGTVRSWKSRYKWDNATLQKSKCSVAKKRGGQPGNRNAAGNSGGAAPPGNKNAVKHGAYEKIYVEALPPEERSLFESIPASDDLDGEIRLLRLKLARLIGRGQIKTYDMFGQEHERDITEAEREKGILEVTAEIRKLVKTKKQIQIAEIKNGLNEDPDETGDDGFLEALNGTAAEDWADEEESQKDISL